MLYKAAKALSNYIVISHLATAVYRLDQFHEHCGLDLTEERSRKMRNDDVIGQSFRGFVKQKPSKDGTRMYSNIERTLPVED